MSDIDDDGIPDIVEKIVGQDLIGPKDVQRIAAVGEVAGRVIDAAEQTIESVAGPAAAEAVGEIVDNVIEGLGTPPVSMRLPEDPPARRVELTDVRDDASIEDFIANVLAQVGDRYQRGVDNSLRNANPDSWDGSELVEWGANRAGSMVNDGAQNQYKQMVRHDGDVSVDVALVTPGAVLYEFTGDPNGSAKPTRASTAISLGDGKHIIDIDPIHGVRIVEAKDFRFTHAGLMPGFVDSHKPGPMTHALVEDALKGAGLEPGPALQVVTAPTTTPPETADDPAPTKDPGLTESTDDEHGPEVEISPASEGSPGRDSADVPPASAGGPQAATDPAPPGRDEVPAPRDPGAPQRSNADEATALEARAQALRAEFLERQAVDRADDMGKLQDLSRQQMEAHAGAEEAKVFAQIRESQAEEARKEATGFEAEAVAADKRGKPAEAEELREQAAMRAAVARRHDANAREATESATRRLAEEEAIRVELVKRGEEYRKEGKDLTAAEGAIDQIEAKARLFRDAEGHAKRAVDLESEAALLRDQGKITEADAKHAAAAQARSAARQSETLAVAHPIDEAKLSEAGLLGGPATTDTPDPPHASLLDDVTGGDATDSAVAGLTASAGLDADAHDGSGDGSDASADGAPDPTVADAPASPGDEVIDAHATAASLVPDLPDASQVAAADDADSDPWGSTAPDEPAPTTDDGTTPDLEA